MGGWVIDNVLRWRVVVAFGRPPIYTATQLSAGLHSSAVAILFVMTGGGLTPHPSRSDRKGRTEVALTRYT